MQRGKTSNPLQAAAELLSIAFSRGDAPKVLYYLHRTAPYRKNVEDISKGTGMSSKRVDRTLTYLGKNELVDYWLSEQQLPYKFILTSVGTALTTFAYDAVLPFVAERFGGLNGTSYKTLRNQFDRIDRRIKKEEE